MTYLCELCGRKGVYRYVKGFQMVTCEPCAKDLAKPENWRLATAPTSRPDYQPLVDEWRTQRYGMMPEE